MSRSNRTLWMTESGRKRILSKNSVYDKVERTFLLMMLVGRNMMLCNISGWCWGYGRTIWRDAHVMDEFGQQWRLAQIPAFCRPDLKLKFYFLFKRLHRRLFKIAVVQTTVQNKIFLNDCSKMKLCEHGSNDRSKFRLFKQLFKLRSFKIEVVQTTLRDWGCSNDCSKLGFVQSTVQNPECSDRKPHGHIPTINCLWMFRAFTTLHMSTNHQRLIVDYRGSFSHLFARQIDQWFL